MNLLSVTRYVPTAHRPTAPEWTMYEHIGADSDLEVAVNPARVEYIVDAYNSGTLAILKEFGDSLTHEMYTDFKDEQSSFCIIKVQGQAPWVVRGYYHELHDSWLAALRGDAPVSSGIA